MLSSTYYVARFIFSFSCFNAFSRVDIRVDVKIPGGVIAYAVDLRGERCECTSSIHAISLFLQDSRHDATLEMWQETYVSALLRAILYSDDATYFLDAYRKLDPIPSPEGEIRFLQAAEALFSKGQSRRYRTLLFEPKVFLGWQVGSDPEIQVATLVSNHLTAGIMKYFGDSGRYQQAANLFEKLSVKEPEVSSLLAKSYIGMSELLFSDVDLMIFKVPFCRRGSQGRPDHGRSHEANTSIIYPTACSV